MRSTSLYRNLRRYYYRTIRPLKHWKNTLLDTEPKLLILIYHRVLPKFVFNPSNTVVSLRKFTRQIDSLTRIYPIISLSEAIYQRRSQSPKANVQIVLTFDDGYWDNYKIIYPILKERGLPAAFFIITDKVGARTQQSYAGDALMRWEDIKKMSQGGMEIGSHSASHRSLTKLSKEEAEAEIRKSKKDIEEKIGVPCEHFAFPFGAKGDYNDFLIKCVREAGFKSCLLNVHGYNHILEDSFSFKRIIMEEETDVKYIFG